MGSLWHCYSHISSNKSHSTTIFPWFSHGFPFNFVQQCATPGVRGSRPGKRCWESTAHRPGGGAAGGRGEHGETMGKPWENHGKTMGKPLEHGGFSWDFIDFMGCTLWCHQTWLATENGPDMWFEAIFQTSIQFGDFLGGMVYFWVVHMVNRRGHVTNKIALRYGFCLILLEMLPTFMGIDWPFKASPWAGAPAWGLPNDFSLAWDCPDNR